MRIKLLMAIILAAINPIRMEAKSNVKSKILVVYYSWGGNTREIAQQIKAASGADLFEIVPTKPYPADYTKCTEVAKADIRKGYLPELKSMPANLAQYDIVFVGSPNWWSTIATPVSSFLSSSDLSGKTVVPFITHGGGGMSNCETAIKKLCPKSKFLEGFAVYGTSARTAQKSVQEWLKRINIVP